MLSNKRNKWDNRQIGFLAGLVAPAITFGVYYLARYPHLNFMEFVHTTIFYGVFTNILALCTIPNLLVFFFFLNREYYDTVRGIIFATFMLTLAVAVYKFL